MSVPKSCAIWKRVRSSARRVSANLLGKAGSDFLYGTAALSGSYRMLQNHFVARRSVGGSGPVLRQPVQLVLDHLPAINPIQGDVAGAAERECVMGRNALAAGLVKLKV